MKKALLSLFFALSFFIGKAQWVNIPDTNFGNWLVQYYPSNCVQGNPQIGFQMDTLSTMDSTLPVTTLDLSNKNLTDVSGLEYLRWQDPNCWGCTQRTLDLSYNELKKMPKGLGVEDVHLNLSHNQIDTAEFTYAYYNIYDINLSYNHLKYVINQVTGTYLYLTDLNFDYNDLNALPYFGTTNDNQLHIRKNNFTSMPLISFRNNYIDCGENLITSITNIPFKLVTLICDHNLLTSLNLQLGSPNFFRNIDCSFNNVTTITNIPVNFWSLKCNDNPNLSCISSKISNLQSLYIGNTQIHCLPNIFSCTTFDINPAILPLCGPSSGCYYTYNTLGNVHIDTSANCILDSLNRGNGIKNAKVLLRKNGNVVNQTYTYNALGDYIILSDSLGSQTISIDTLKLPFNVKCPTTQERNINFTFADTIIYNQDFGLECKGVDLASFSVNVNPRCRPGRQSSVVISAGDIVKQFFNTSCSNNVSGTYTTILNGPGTLC
jgi:hypothetical protein